MNELVWALLGLAAVGGVAYVATGSKPATPSTPTTPPQTPPQTPPPTTTCAGGWQPVAASGQVLTGQQVRVTLDAASVAAVLTQLKLPAGLPGWTALVQTPQFASLIASTTVPQVWGPGMTLPSDWPTSDTNAATGYHLAFTYGGPAPLSMGAFGTVPIVAWTCGAGTPPTTKGTGPTGNTITQAFVQGEGYTSTLTLDTPLYTSGPPALSDVQSQLDQSLGAGVSVAVAVQTPSPTVLLVAFVYVGPAATLSWQIPATWTETLTDIGSVFLPPGSCPAPDSTHLVMTVTGVQNGTGAPDNPSLTGSLGSTVQVMNGTCTAWVSLTSSDPTVLTVDATSGIGTLVGAGTCELAGTFVDVAGGVLTSVSGTVTVASGSAMPVLTPTPDPVNGWPVGTQWTITWPPGSVPDEYPVAVTGGVTLAQAGPGVSSGGYLGGGGTLTVSWYLDQADAENADNEQTAGVTIAP